MKVVAVIGLLSLVGLALAGTELHPRGCIYAIGRCVQECEVGTHAYAIGCGFITPEPTCEMPAPQERRDGAICDYSACYCDPPTVRDAVTKQCVRLEDCPKIKED